MTNAITRVRRARAALLGTVVGATLSWGAVAATGVIVLFALVDLAVPLPLGVRRLAVPAAAAGAMAAALIVLWRGRHARTLARVALYIEERVPALQFALATALDAATAPGAPALEQAVSRVELRGALRAPVARALSLPAAALALGMIALALLPGGTLERVLHPRPGDILLRPAVRAPLGNRLAAVAVRVEPPGYARRDARIVDDPTSVAALVGSRVIVRGRGAAAGATDSLGAQFGEGGSSRRDTLPVAVAGDTWSVAVTMPKKPAVVRLVDRGYDRLLVLEPVIDEPPTVTLVSPARDSVYPQGKGRIALFADVQDDIGLSRVEFELLHTTGTENHIETKRTTLARGGLDHARTTTFRGAILLDTMRLGPGDVLHVRAVAWDENDVTGPGKGESETRTIRIFDPRKRDTVNVNPAAAAALDTSILSERMLIMRADTLLRNKRRLIDTTYTRRSMDLGMRQDALRSRVLSIVYDLEYVQGVGFVGETPSSKILKKAAEAMLDATTELRIAQVDDALPHMKRALKFLMDARNAKRYWLRGLLVTQPIEIDKVRLTGSDSATVAPRDPRDRGEEVRRRLLQRIDRALVVVDRSPAAGSDSLRMILVDVLTEARDVADPLRRAIDAMRSGQRATAPLIEVRRRLERETVTAPTLSDWQGVP
ncbi:MAG TPA: hypothetical protein VF041_12050 [Gemmatimonadaceae bacterium]